MLEGRDPSGLGLGSGMPSLADGEVDEEVDASVGRTATLTWVNMDGSWPDWASKREADITVLSTCLPGISEEDPSFTIKCGVDGALFTLAPSSSASNGPEWVHNSTHSALAFVLASKQETRFTYHVPAKAVLAFEGGGQGKAGNLYVYRAHRLGELWAKQAVLKFSDGLHGALLGVGALTTLEGKVIILGLSEGELIIIHDLL